MKSSFLLTLLFLTTSFVVHAQQEVSLDNLKTPNSPGFQILDISPSNIERPTSPKEFALSIFNLTNNGTAFPKNFAFEIAPYWFFKPSTENVYKYLNLKASSTGIKQGIATGGILRKLSLSLSSSFNDSVTGSLLANTNYVAFGIKTNIITINGSKRIAVFEKTFKTMAARIREVSFAGDSVLSANAIDSALKNDTAYQAAIAQLPLGEAATAPLFQADIAYAYSEAFINNEYSDRRFNKSGLWLSASLYGGSLLKSKKDQLFITALGRAVWDNALTDTVHSVFERKNAYDFGGKIDWTIGNFSLSFEHLRRIYSGTTDLNSHRTVGVIQYKINENLYLTGSYGETFGKSDNLLTLFGINWNFGSTALPIPKP